MTFLLLLSLLFHTSLLSYQEELSITPIPLEIQEGFKSFNVNDYVIVFSEADTLTTAEAFAKINAGLMTLEPYEGNPGMTNSDVAYWLMFIVENASENEEFILELAYPQLDYAQFAEVDTSGVISTIQTGDQFVFDRRPFSHRNFVFPIAIKKGERKTFLLNADKRKSAIRFPLTLMTESAFQEQTEKERTYLSIYYVFIILIVLGAAVVGIGLRKTVFLWFALSVTCYGLWLFTWQGFSYKYLIPNWPVLNRHFLPFCSQIAVLSLLAFIQSFFETKRLMPKFNAVMNGILAFFILGTIIWVIIPETYIEFAPKLFAVRYLAVGCILVFGITAAIRYTKVNRQRSLIFALSYSVFFIGIIGKILDEYGVISEFSFVYDPILIGNLVQVLGLSIAMIIILIGIVNEREALKSRTEELEQSILQLELESKANKTEFLTLRSRALIPIDKIKYIQSDGPYVEVYVEDKDKPEIDRQSLSKMTEGLPDHFKQIHRSVIVNFKQVKIKRVNSLTLNDETTLTISRSFKDELRDYSA